LNTSGTERAAITYVNSADAVYHYTAAGGNLFNLVGGNVGTGTTAPLGKLTVEGDGSVNNSSGLIRIANTGGSTWGGIALVDGQTTVTNASNYYLIGRAATLTDRVMSLHIPTAGNYGSGAEPKVAFYSTGADMLFSVEATTGTAYHKGNVGIGTTSPQKKLEVITGNTDYASVGVAALGVGQWTGIHFGYRENNQNYRKSAIVFERTDLTANDAQGKIHILNGPQGGAGSATLSDAKITIGEGGYVGIGSTAPARRLDVVEGNVQIIANFTNTSTTSARIKFTDANTGAENVNIGAVGTRMAMWTNNAERVSILSGGNVGIGTTNPAARLHVSGTLRVDNAGSAPTTTEPFEPGGVSGYYGANQTYLLGSPNAWLAINVSGTAYVIPLYTE
jgi:hypothetical protein